ARVLCVFHGGVQVGVVSLMMEWERVEVLALARELVEVGLATPNPYDHLSLDPALGLYLRTLFDDAEHVALIARWAKAMAVYADALRYDGHQNAQRAQTVASLDLPNLMAFLAHVARGADHEATVAIASSLQELLNFLGRPQLLARVGQIREIAAAQIGT